MNPDFVQKLGTKFAADLNETLSSYLDKIEYKKVNDIELVAQSLIENFGGSDWLKPEVFSEKIRILKTIEHISPQTQHSLNQRLESAEEIYTDGQYYVEPPLGNRKEENERTARKITALQQLIINKICKTAEHLRDLTFEERKRYIGDFETQRAEDLNKHKALESKIENLRSNTLQKNTTISDRQMLLTHAIKMEMEDADLQHLRNCEVDLHDDTPLLKILFERDPSFLYRYIDLLKLNRGFIIDVVSNDPYIVKQIEDQLPYLKDIVIAAVKKNVRSIRYFHFIWRFDEDVVSAGIEQDPTIFEYLEEDLRSKKKIAFSYLKATNNFNKVSPSLLNDSEFVLSLLRDNPNSSAVMYAGDACRNNAQFAFDAIAIDPQNLQYFNPSLLCNEQIALAAISKHPNLFSLLRPYYGLDERVTIEAVALCDENTAHIKSSDITDEFLVEVISTKIFHCLENQQLESTTDLDLLLDSSLKNAPLINEHLEAKSKKDEILARALWNALEKFLKTFDELRFKDLALIAVKKRGEFLRHLGPNLRGEEDIVLAALRSSCDPNLYYRAGSKCKHSQKIALEVARLNSTKSNGAESILSLPRDHFNSLAVNYAEDNYRNEVELALESIALDPQNVKHIDPFLLCDEQIALASISKDPKLFSLVKPYYGIDEKVTIEAVALCDENTVHIKSTDITTEFLEEVIGAKIYHLLENRQSERDIDFDLLLDSALKDAPLMNEHLQAKSEKDEILAGALWHALEKVLNTFDDLRFKDLALIAVKKRGEFLRHLGPNLGDDEDIVLAALRSSCDPNLYYRASSKCKLSQKIALEVVNLDCTLYKSLDKQLKEDKEIIQIAVNTAMTDSLFENSELLQRHRDIPLTLLEGALSRLELECDKRLLKDVTEEGYRESICEFFKLADSINFRNLALKIVNANGIWLGELGNIFKDDPEIVLTAIKNRASAFSMAGSKCRSDPKIALEAVKLSGGNLEFVDRAMRGDRKLVSAAVKQNFSAMRFADRHLRDDLTFVPFTRLFNFLKVGMRRFFKLF